jgi:hypothetical protein
MIDNKGLVVIAGIEQKVHFQCFDLPHSATPLSAWLPQRRLKEKDGASVQSTKRENGERVYRVAGK